MRIIILSHFQDCSGGPSVIDGLDTSQPRYNILGVWGSEYSLSATKTEARHFFFFFFLFRVVLLLFVLLFTVLFPETLPLFHRGSRGMASIGSTKFRPYNSEISCMAIVL